MQTEGISVGLLLLSLLWGEAACLFSRWSVKEVVLELGFSGMTKKKLNKLLLKHSLLDAIFMLGFRRDAKTAKHEITYWCVINGICVFMIIMLPVVDIIGYQFPHVTWVYHILYSLPTVWAGFVVFTIPISSKNTRETLI